MYKLSEYNYEVKHDNRMIYFNGISSHFFSVSMDEYQFMKNMFIDLISFEIQYPSLFSKLKEWNFIIDEEKTELDIIRYRNRRSVFLDKSYRLFVNPTLDCNFKCWYCIQDHPKGYMNKEVFEMTKNHIRYMIEDVKITSFQLDWFGGEPLLYFNEIIYPLAVYAREVSNKNNIPFVQNITTNASLIDENMVYAMKDIGLSSFQITIDGDEKRHDKIRNSNGQPSFRKIMDNINLLCKIIPDIHVNLRLNYDDQTLAKSDMFKVFEQIDTQYRSKITPILIRVWQTVKEEMQQNDKRLEIYRLCTKLGYQTGVPGTGFALNKQTHCYADKYYHAELNYDGSVFKCTAPGHGKERVAGKLFKDGRIEWKRDVIEKMYSQATFENEMCLKCKHLPICMGPCSQKVLKVSKENIEKVCVLKLEEIKPESFIVECYNKMYNSINNILK